jgi:ABC-type glycerol-3-phosphate transport system substrate-binding protein
MKIFHFSFLLLAVIAIGCGRGGDEFDRFEGRKITIWETYANEEREVFRELVKDFERHWAATHNGERIMVKVEPLPFQEHVQKIKFAAITGTAPDIVRVDAGELVDLAYGQILLDLRSLDPGVDSFLSTFIIPARESVKIGVRQPDNTVKEGVYGIPDQITGVALYYNRRLFRAKNIPFPPATLKEMIERETKGLPRWDMEEFARVAGLLTDTAAATKVYGIALNNSLWFSLPFFNAFGADFVSIASDGTFQCTIGSDSGVRALTAIVSLFWKGFEAGSWAPGAIGADQGFINGMYAMNITGPWNLKSFEGAGVDFGVGLFPEGPNVRDIVTPTATYRVGTSTNVGGTDMAVLKTSRDPELAYAFLKYLTSREPHAKWCNALGQIPMQMLSEDLIDYSKNPSLITFVDQMRTAMPRPKIPRYGVLEGQIMVPQIERAFRARREEGVREALEQAAREIDRLILKDVNVSR